MVGVMLTILYFYILASKNLGGVDATTYAYNVRSWTKDITGSRFSENLYYNANTVGLPNFIPAYNGNIAGMQWGVANESGNRSYSFAYDGLNRLTDAIYTGFNNGVISGTQNRYDEHFGFDKMGNFNSLTRYENGSLLNNLSFNYTGNQLKKVDNSVSPYIPYGSEAFNDRQKIDTEYYYDQNGSTTADVNSGISTIQYNLLNLPDQIQFTEGHKNLYTYNAGGAKLRAVNYTVNNIVNVPIGSISTLPGNPSDYTTLTTDYVGNVIYQNGSLKQIMLPEGYWQGGVFYYYLKDHLGDTRVVINSSGAIIEKSHYYPSGMRFADTSTSNSSALPYRYNGKEMETMNGLNQMDYGARRRYSGLPIFTTRDPLAEKRSWESLYAYCGNNSINRVDPTGMIWEDPKDAENLNKSINKQIKSTNKDNEKIQKQIDKGGLSEKQLAKLQNKLADNNTQIGLLNKSLGDVKAIGDAKETYTLSGPSQSDGTHGVVKDENGIIRIEGSNTGLHLHEIRHIGQSIEAGGVRFNKDGKLINATSTRAGARNNEVNAYQVEYSYDGSYPVSARSLKDINENTLMNIRKEDGTAVYENLKDPK